MTQPTREEALAHFGVKGMRWGVKSASPGTSSPGKTYQLSDKQKKVLKTTGKVAIAVAVTAGAAYAGKQLGSHGKFTLSEMNTYAARHSGDVAARFIRDNIDFEVALNQIRNVEAGHYNRLGLGPSMDSRRLRL